MIQSRLKDSSYTSREERNITMPGEFEKEINDCKAWELCTAQEKEYVVNFRSLSDGVRETNVELSKSTDKWAKLYQKGLWYTIAGLPIGAPYKDVSRKLAIVAKNYHDDRIKEELALHCGGRSLIKEVFKRVLEAKAERATRRRKARTSVAV